MPPPEQGKDLAEYNAREQTAVRLAREAHSQAHAARLARLAEIRSQAMERNQCRDRDVKTRHIIRIGLPSNTMRFSLGSLRRSWQTTP
jgi:hypothetical protein